MRWDNLRKEPVSTITLLNPNHIGVKDFLIVCGGGEYLNHVCFFRPIGKKLTLNITDHRICYRSSKKEQSFILPFYINIIRIYNFRQLMSMREEMIERQEKKVGNILGESKVSASFLKCHGKKICAHLCITQ